MGKVSYEIFQFVAGSVYLPHIHPHSAELLFVLGRSIEVGFIDTTTKFFTQTLTDSDMFVFPKCLVHYKFISDSYRYALRPSTISAFASANPRTVSIPGAIFNTSMDDGLVTESFKPDGATIQRSRIGFYSIRRRISLVNNLSPFIGGSVMHSLYVNFFMYFSCLMKAS